MREIQSASGKIGRIVAFRLRPGTDVMEGITAMCEKENIKNGVILSMIGSLNGAKVFNPEPLATSKIGFGYGDPIKFGGAIELVTGAGMICHSEKDEVLLHVHVSLSDRHGNAYGGHLIPGNIVLLTVDVMIGVIEGIDMVRKYDDETEIPMFSPTQL